MFRYLDPLGLLLSLRVEIAVGALACECWLYDSGSSGLCFTSSRGSLRFCSGKPAFAMAYTVYLLNEPTQLLLPFGVRAKARRSACS